MRTYSPGGVLIALTPAQEGSIPPTPSTHRLRPGGVLIALTPAQEGSIPPTPSTHRLRPGLPGYLIPFATLAFASQRQTQSRKAPSPLVFLPISTHSTATPGIPPTSRLRHWCSSRYLRIPPLHREFRLPLHYSRKTVLKAVYGLSP